MTIAPDTGFRQQVANYYGDLEGLALSHQHSGLQQALQVPGGLADWVEAHPPPDQPEDSE